MILSKDKQGNWTPTAGGTGTFIGTLAAFNAIKDTLPVNTVAYITDDGNGDLQPVDAVTNGDMHPVTSNAVYDAMNTVTATIACSIKGNIELRKSGKIVQLRYLQVDPSTFTPTTENAWVKVASIPEGFRPLQQVYLMEQGSNSNVGRWQIFTNGDVMFYKFGAIDFGWETALNAVWII